MGGGNMDEIWEDRSPAATILSPKSNVLAAWRLEPSLLLSSKQSYSSKDSAADAWIAQASQRDMESLTLALHKELCSRNDRKLPNSAWQGADTVKTECASDGGSPVTSSEIDSTGSPISGNAFPPRPLGGAGLAGSHGAHQATAKQCANPLSARGSAGKVSKRRSRAANKSPITFLAADPANFRAMVQQVTGFPLSPGARVGVAAPLVRPEPTRPPPSSHAVHNSIQGLPTLDTSALLIDSATAPPICRADMPARNSVHLSSLVPLSSPNSFPNGLRVDPLAGSSSDAMRGELLTRKLKAACLKANRGILRSEPIDFPDIKPPRSSISADSFLPMENEQAEYPRCNMSPAVAMYDNNIFLLDSWFNPDGLINSS